MRLRVVPALAALLLCLLAAATARAQGDLHINLLRYGTYEVDTEFGRLDPTFRQQTLSGVRLTGEPHFTTQTDRIVAHLCTRFGVQFETVGLPAGNMALLTVRLTHPLLHRPDGRSGTVDLYDTALSTSPTYAGFQFTHQWELASGTWTYDLLVGDRVLLTKSFEVTATPTPGETFQDCGRVIS
jgi:hypothetical protein